jgi:hypothetical protein
MDASHLKRFFFLLFLASFLVSFSCRQTNTISSRMEPRDTVGEYYVYDEPFMEVSRNAKRDDRLTVVEQYLISEATDLREWFEYAFMYYVIPLVLLCFVYHGHRFFCEVHGHCVSAHDKLTRNLNERAIPNHPTQLVLADRLECLKQALPTIKVAALMATRFYRHRFNPPRTNGSIPSSMTAHFPYLSRHHL